MAWKVLRSNPCFKGLFEFNFCCDSYFAFLQSVLLLCGFFLFVIPALSIRCYRQTCDGTECVGRKETVECESDADRCASMTYITEGDTDSVSRNCARSGQDCDQTPCDSFESTMDNWGLSISNCNVTCCEGNGCNAPSQDAAKYVKHHPVKLHHAQGKRLGQLTAGYLGYHKPEFAMRV